MMVVIYFAFVLFGFLLLARSLWLMRAHKDFYIYLLVNGGILLLYSVWWFNYSELITGSDPIGMGAFIFYPLILSLHSIITYILISVKLNGAIKRLRKKAG